MAVPARWMGFAVALAASPAGACTLCHSGVAGAVRAAVTANLPGDLAALLAPFPVLLAAVALVRRCAP